MCNPAEEAGIKNASDSEKNDVRVSETDNLVTCANTYACVSVKATKANGHPSSGCMVDVAEDEVGHLTIDSLIETDVTDDDQPPDRSDHSAKELHTSGKGGQEVIEQVDRSKGSSISCTALATSFPEGDGITLLCHCNSNLEECKDDGHPFPAEHRTVKSTPNKSESLSEKTSSDREDSRIEREESEEKTLQENIVGEFISLADASDGENAKISKTAAVKPLDSTSSCDGRELCGKASDELCMCSSDEPCMFSNNGARRPEREIHMVHADDATYTVNSLSLGSLVEGSEDQFTKPCTDTNGVLAVNNADSSSDVKEKVLKNFDESLAGMNGRPGTSDSLIEQVASVMVVSSTEDKSKHAPSSFKEPAEEITSEIEQEEDTVPSVQVEVTAAVLLEGSGRPELASFFSNARGSKLEEEIEEQHECASASAKLPIKNKIFMESPRSLRMLLFSEQTALPTKKEEKHRKDGRCMEFSSRVVPTAESHGDEDHMEHNYPSKWYEDADNADISSAFSGPIACSGALTYQGLISFSGQVPYSGNISHRSDSSTSTRSFAFPILASEWNSSPVKMGDPDPRFYRKRRKWCFCFCCARPSTLFD